jgi:release factor glutamine methyltransferase
VLDVGTGSGAVALAIATELASCEVVATDTSLDALAVAKANRDRLGLTDRVRLSYGTVEPGGFDLVVANLPYVTAGEWQGLAPEIREFEPREAVTPGPSGLEAIEALLAELALADQPSEAVALEVGRGQAPLVAELVRRAGFEHVEARQDLASIERVVLGWM